MEKEILKLKFENIAIVRPSMLLGERKEKRTGELIGKMAMKILHPLLIGKNEEVQGYSCKECCKSHDFHFDGGPGLKISICQR